MSLHRKQYQCPLATACECFDNIIKIKQPFPDKAFWNHLLKVCDAAAVHLSTNVSLWLSMTLCLIYKTKSSDTIRGAIKNKLSTCSLHWNSSDICTKTWTSCLNQTCQSKRSFTASVLTTESSMDWIWIQLLYIVLVLYLFISIIFVFDATLAFSVIKCQPLSGRGLCWEDDYSSMSCSGGVFMHTTAPKWRHLAPRIQNKLFLELD